MFKTTGIIIGIALLALLGTESKGDDVVSTNAVSTNQGLRATSRDTNASSRVYPPASTNAASKDVDNTEQNTRDRSGATVTPGDQGNNKSDLETTRRIRRALTDNGQLSTTAKNIKIVTSNGKVTLRGPVDTRAEQQTIIAIAKGVAGDSSVDNQLEVKAFKQ
jgi:osmotically-inducible protein OsmY